MSDLDAIELHGSEGSLRPNWVVLIGGGTAIGLVSALSLPSTVAVASTVLGMLMLAGADIDSRTFLLPDLVTLGAVVCGVVAAALLDATTPWTAATYAIARAACVGAGLAAFRSSYAWLRGRDGLGFGDVKLAAAIGAWLPIEAIPSCFGLATSSALLVVLAARLKGEAIEQTTRIPLGAFLCPALWVVFYADRVMRG